MHAKTHAHALCYSLLVILAALIMPDVRYSDNTKRILRVLLILGVILCSIFEWFRFVPYNSSRRCLDFGCGSHEHYWHCKRIKRIIRNSLMDFNDIMWHLPVKSMDIPHLRPKPI